MTLQQPVSYIVRKQACSPLDVSGRQGFPRVFSPLWWSLAVACMPLHPKTILCRSHN